MRRIFARKPSVSTHSGAHSGAQPRYSTLVGCFIGAPPGEFTDFKKCSYSIKVNDNILAENALMNAGITADSRVIYETEREALRQELFNLKSCQITFLTASVTATSALLGAGVAVSNWLHTG